MRQPGFVSGKTLDSSDQVSRPKTTSQLQLTPILMPAMRPSVKVLFTSTPP